jgi:hypothetical protein
LKVFQTAFQCQFLYLSQSLEVWLAVWQAELQVALMAA